MDNFEIDVKAEGLESLRRALAIAFSHNAPGSEATHWIELPAGSDGGVTLVLLWGEEGKSHPLPAPLDAEGATSLASTWLAKQNFGEQPDHDGDNGRGWRVFCDGWGHVRGYHYGIVGISPWWAMYGK